MAIFSSDRLPDLVSDLWFVFVLIFRRPSIEEVAGLIVGQIMTQLEKVSISEQRLAKALTLERAGRRGGLETGPNSPARLTPAAAHAR
jgi:hypothetical protein